MDTNNFIFHLKTKDFFIFIAKDVEQRSDTSNNELDRALPQVKNKKVIGLMKND